MQTWGKCLGIDKLPAQHIIGSWLQSPPVKRTKTTSYGCKKLFTFWKRGKFLSEVQLFVVSWSIKRLILPKDILNIEKFWLTLASSQNSIIYGNFKRVSKYFCKLKWFLGTLFPHSTPFCTYDNKKNFSFVKSPHKEKYRKSGIMR